MSHLDYIRCLYKCKVSKLGEKYSICIEKLTPPFEHIIGLGCYKGRVYLVRNETIFTCVYIFSDDDQFNQLKEIPPKRFGTNLGNISRCFFFENQIYMTSSLTGALFRFDLDLHDYILIDKKLNWNQATSWYVLDKNLTITNQRRVSASISHSELSPNQSALDTSNVQGNSNNTSISMEVCGDDENQRMKGFFVSFHNGTQIWSVNLKDQVKQIPNAKDHEISLIVHQIRYSMHIPYDGFSMIRLNPSSNPSSSLEKKNDKSIQSNDGNELVVIELAPRFRYKLYDSADFQVALMDGKLQPNPLLTTQPFLVCPYPSRSSNDKHSSVHQQYTEDVFLFC